MCNCISFSFTLLSVEAAVVGDVRGVAVLHVLLHRPDDFAESPVATYNNGKLITACYRV